MGAFLLLLLLCFEIGSRCSPWMKPAIGKKDPPKSTKRLCWWEAGLKVDLLRPRGRWSGGGGNGDNKVGAIVNKTNIGLFMFRHIWPLNMLVDRRPQV